MKCICVFDGKTERKNNLGNTGVDEKKIFKIPVTGSCE
jgi:hypothetical protein